MPYLIDGHNLIPKVPGLNLDAMDDESELIQRLQAFCQMTGKRVEVYFDQAPAGQVRSQTYGNVKAHFIRKGRTADAALIARLSNLGKAARNWSVVTSDREIVRAARSARAEVITSAEFAALLAGAGGGGDAEGEESGVGVSPDVQLGADEVDQWLALFGGGDDL